MTRILFVCCFAWLTLPNALPAQDLGVHTNGLMYDERTVAQLRHIVDSLHLRYKVCDPNPRYNAFWQCTGHAIALDTLTEQAEADLKTGLSLADLARRYPQADIDTQVLAVAFYDSDDKAHTVRLYPGENHWKMEQPFLRFDQVRAGDRSVVRYDGYGGKQQLKAFLFTTPWQSPALPPKWAQMVQYGECMIDTSTTTFLSSLEDREPDTLGTSTPERNRLFAMIDYPVPLPVRGERDGYWEKIQVWEVAQQQYIREVVSKRPGFQQQLQRAVDEAVRLHLPDLELERVAANFLLPTQQLALMRLRQVWGSCSQDSRPRQHARDVAILAAQTGTWEVFLRAHLDIMNDRFHRAIDASYAWGQRGTHLAELEALDLDVPQLLVGTLLRAKDLSEHHYFGSTGRVGRALAESQRRDAVENLFQSAIADPELDPFNRLICFYAYHTFISWKFPGTGDNSEAARGERKRQLEAEWAKAEALLPGFLQGRGEDD